MSQLSPSFLQALTETLGTADSRIEQAPAADKGALLAVIGLLLCILGISIHAAPLLAYTQALALQLLEPQAYINAMQAFRVIERN